MLSPKWEERRTVSVDACASVHPRRLEASQSLLPMRPHVRGDLQFCFSRRLFPVDEFVKNQRSAGDGGRTWCLV